MRKSTIILRCGHPKCDREIRLDFMHISEIVCDDAIIFPAEDKGWREIEAGEGDEYFIACPDHDIELRPQYVVRTPGDIEEEEE